MSSRFGEDALTIRNPEETVERIKRFLATHVARIGTRFLIVGMSGGLDSSVTAALCSQAVGGKKTLGFCLPEAETRKEKNIEDAHQVAKQFRIKLRVIDVTKLTETASNTVVQLKRETRIASGNMKARLRAMILYYFANVNGGLVVGTGDKSEIALGYFTKYGDGACDVQPLADLYKTSVRQLAEHLGLPKRVSSKPSSPELWPGQSAEGELGLGYDKLDRILWGLERWMSPQEIAVELGMSMKTVERVKSRWLASEHKRRPPLAMKLGFRTAGQDLRIPYSL
jgi:NAD+ synthase